MQINNCFQKNANMSMVAQLLWRYPGTSRIDIAKKIGVYRSTISNIMNSLIDNGIVLEERDKKCSSLGGRKPLRLELNPSFGCVLGIEMQPSGYTAAATDFTGVLLFSHSAPLPKGEFTSLPELIVEEIEKEVRALGIPLLAVCVGMPGIIDSVHGTVIQSDIFNARTAAFSRLRGPLSHVPLFIENEANCLAWHELLRLREQECGSFLCINTEYTGDASRFSSCNGLSVGVGIALNGRVYSGSRFAAGEFVSYQWNGDSIGQGNFSVSSNFSTEKNTVFNGWVHEVFESLIPTVSLLDAHAVIVHGEFARKQGEVKRILDRDVPKFAAILKRTGCELLFSDGDSRAVSLGAAHMFLMRLFSMRALEESSEMCLTWEGVIETATKIVETKTQINTLTP